MSNATLESILTQHAIPRNSWEEWQSLVFDGNAP